MSAKNINLSDFKLFIVYDKKNKASYFYSKPFKTREATPWKNFLANLERPETADPNNIAVAVRGDYVLQTANRDHIILRHSTISPPYYFNINLSSLNRSEYETFTNLEEFIVLVKAMADKEPDDTRTSIEKDKRTLHTLESDRPYDSANLEQSLEEYRSNELNLETSDTEKIEAIKSEITASLEGTVQGLSLSLKLYAINIEYTIDYIMGLESQTAHTILAYLILTNRHHIKPDLNFIKNNTHILKSNILDITTADDKLLRELDDILLNDTFLTFKKLTFLHVVISNINDDSSFIYAKNIIDDATDDLIEIKDNISDYINGNLLYIIATMGIIRDVRIEHGQSNPKLAEIIEEKLNIYDKQLDKVPTINFGNQEVISLDTNSTYYDYLYAYYNRNIQTQQPVDPPDNGAGLNPPVEKHSSKQASSGEVQNVDYTKAIGILTFLKGTNITEFISLTDYKEFFLDNKAFTFNTVSGLKVYNVATSRDTSNVYTYKFKDVKKCTEFKYFMFFYKQLDYIKKYMDNLQTENMQDITVLSVIYTTYVYNNAKSNNEVYMDISDVVRKISDNNNIIELLKIFSKLINHVLEINYYNGSNPLKLIDDQYEKYYNEFIEWINRRKESINYYIEQIKSSPNNNTIIITLLNSLNSAINIDSTKLWQMLTTAVYSDDDDNVSRDDNSDDSSDDHSDGNDHGHGHGEYLESADEDDSTESSKPITAQTGTGTPPVAKDEAEKATAAAEAKAEKAIAAAEAKAEKAIAAAEATAIELTNRNATLVNELQGAIKYIEAIASPDYIKAITMIVEFIKEYKEKVNSMDDHNYKLSELIETFSKYNETHNIEDAHQSLNNAKTNTETLKQRAVTELAATNAKMTQLEIKISGLQSALATANTQIATLTANITTLKTEKSSLETHLTSRQADISKLNADLTAAQGSLASLEAQLKTPNTSDTSELEKSIQAKQKVINDLNAALVAADQTKSSINKELDDVKKTLADTTTQYSDAMTNIQTLENKSATAKQEKTTMQAKIDDLTALIQKHADEERVRNVAESEDKARRIGQQKKSREEHQRELDQFKQEAVDAADRATKLTEYVKRLESDKQHLELERAPTNSAALLALYKNAKAKEEQQQQPAKPADPKKIKPRAN